jgi:Electron transfer DM13
LLTFTDFDVDPGVDVEVYLTPGTDSVDDRLELGGLKGNVGDQQYEIRADADLRRYDTVILWCTPFTVRIAVAPLAS